MMKLYNLIIGTDFNLRLHIKYFLRYEFLNTMNNNECHTLTWLRWTLTYFIERI